MVHILPAPTHRRRSDVTYPCSRPRKFLADLEPTLSEDGGQYADIQSWTSKHTARLLRLAALFTLLEDPDAKVVTTDAVKAAFSLNSYFAAHAQAAFSLMRKDGYVPTSGKHRILRWLAGQPAGHQFNHSDAYAAVKKKWARGPGASDRVRQVLAGLAEDGWVREVQAQKSSRGGRPSQRYEAHPQLVRFFKEGSHRE